jgi:hypothetical protein
MKKILATLLVGGLVVGGVVVVKGASAAATPEGKMCVRMAELCSTDAPKPADFEQCVDGMKKLRKMSGDASFEKSQKCLDESQSCAAASGCMVGGIGVGSVGEMMKGFGNAVTK